MTFTIASFSSVRLSAIISVRVTKVLSVIRFVPSSLKSMPLPFGNHRSTVAAIRAQRPCVRVIRGSSVVFSGVYSPHLMAMAAPGSRGVKTGVGEWWKKYPFRS